MPRRCNGFRFAHSHSFEILAQMPVDILITDSRVPEIGGVELPKRVRESYPQTAVMVLTQYGTIDSAVEALRLDASDYITKPFHIPELRGKLDRMVRVLNLDQENRVLRETLRTRPGFAGLIGVSVKMQRVYRLIEKISQHAYPVLILGEKRHRERTRRPLRSLFRSSPHQALYPRGLLIPGSDSHGGRIIRTRGRRIHRSDAHQAGLDGNC